MWCFPLAFHLDILWKQAGAAAGSSGLGNRLELGLFGLDF